MGAPDFWAATSETMSSAYVHVPADPSIGIDEEQTAKFACYIADLWYYAEGVDTQPVPFTCGPWSLLVDEVSSWAIRHTDDPVVRILYFGTQVATVVMPGVHG